MTRRARSLTAIAIAFLAGAWPGGIFEFETPSVLARVVTQAEAGGSLGAGAPGSSYVLAAYVITGGLLVGYGLTLWWRSRAARQELAFWRLEAAGGTADRSAMDGVEMDGVSMDDEAGGEEAARR
jgi:hypothetical protein